MTGTAFPSPATTEVLRCERCKAELTLHPETAVPQDWMQVVLACGAIVFCPVCIAEHGGSRSALKRQSDEIHRDGGGCPGCKA